jgi:hypothetical protein
MFWVIKKMTSQIENINKYIKIKLSFNIGLSKVSTFTIGPFNNFLADEKGAITTN